MAYDLIDLKRHVLDAVEHLGWAARLAGELSGSSGGRAPCPEFGDPGEEAVEGWPALDRLADELEGLCRKVDEAFTQEIREACEAEEAYQDEMSDRADGLSY